MPKQLCSALLSMQMFGNMICRHREEWLGHIEMMTALSAFYNSMKRGQDKRFLSQLACFIDCFFVFTSFVSMKNRQGVVIVVVWYMYVAQDCYV